MQLINTNINFEKLKEYNKDMTKVALDEIESGDELNVLFTKCLSNAGNVRLNEFDMDVVNLIRLEISKEVFHTRVNEFMEANEELNLER
jgi:hypothetical protein